MKILDRIVYNRLIHIVLNFILSLVKIIYPSLKEDLNNPLVPPTRRRKIFPRTEKENNE
jgi:hypothetical protein